ncbi:MAG: alginate O-acetyltransferase AlgF [Alphaproteobacteria bacterium]|nr:alginate O-acetyltransferase AlgF [Alphaproteobacteria bacterium]
MIAALLLATSALAADGLYAPAPPPGSAFVRVVNATDAPTKGVAVAGKPLGALEPGACSPYVVVPEGARSAALGGGLKASVEVHGGAFYTIGVLPGPQQLVLEDATNPNLARARVTLYNLSGAPSVDLKLADGAQTVVAGVAPGETGHRVVNPVSADLAVFAGDAPVETFTGLHLERGAAYSVFVTGAPGALSASWVVDETRP